MANPEFNKEFKNYQGKNNPLYEAGMKCGLEAENPLPLLLNLYPSGTEINLSDAATAKTMSGYLDGLRNFTISKGLKISWDNSTGNLITYNENYLGRFILGLPTTKKPHLSIGLTEEEKKKDMGIRIKAISLETILMIRKAGFKSGFLIGAMKKFNLKLDYDDIPDDDFLFVTYNQGLENQNMRLPLISINDNNIRLGLYWSAYETGQKIRAITQKK